MQLPIEIQKESGIPIYVQFLEQVRMLVHSGQLAPGAAMPTVREMAVALGINYNTVTRVYRDLQREGLLVLKRGIGSFIAEQVSGKTVSPKDLSGLKHGIRQLIARCKDLEMTATDLERLVKMTWKELENE